jgi:hypothetical protein
MGAKVMIRKSLACGPFVLAALFAGCGAGNDPREAHAFRAPEKVEACALFPYQEAQAIANMGVSTLSSTYDDAVGRDTKICTYNAGSVEVPQILGLEVRPAETVRDAERRQEAGRSFLGTLSKGEVQDVPGVGDAALWAGGTVEQLHARKGAVNIVVTIQAGKDPLGAAKQVAERAFARMQQQIQTQAQKPAKP